MENIDNKELKKAGSIIRAARHFLRLKLLDYILENQPIHVTKIYKQLKLEQSVASSHLAILRRANFLVTKKDGKKIFYSINVNKVDKVVKAIAMYADAKI